MSKNSKFEIIYQTLQSPKEERSTSHIRNEYLNHTERSNKITSLQSSVREKESQIFLLTKEKERLLSRRNTLLGRIQEYSKRGSMKLVCHQLNRAEEGRLDDKNVLKEVIATCAKNISKKKQGKRHSRSVKEFYETLMYWGGPRIATFVSLNLEGPDSHTIYKYSLFIFI